MAIAPVAGSVPAPACTAFVSIFMGRILRETSKHLTVREGSTISSTKMATRSPRTVSLWIGLAEIVEGGFVEAGVAGAQGLVDSGCGRGFGARGFEEAPEAVGARCGFVGPDRRERPGVSEARLLRGISHPRSFEVAQRSSLSILKSYNQRSRIATGSPSFHPLGHTFLQPSGGAPRRLLKHKTVGELVLQNVLQQIGDVFQALHRDANAPVVESAGPTRHARQILKYFFGI